MKKITVIHHALHSTKDYGKGTIVGSDVLRGGPYVDEMKVVLVRFKNNDIHSFPVEMLGRKELPNLTIVGEENN